MPGQQKKNCSCNWWTTYLIFDLYVSPYRSPYRCFTDRPTAKSPSDVSKMLFSQPALKKLNLVKRHLQNTTNPSNWSQIIFDTISRVTFVQYGIYMIIHLPFQRCWKNLLGFSIRFDQPSDRSQVYFRSEKLEGKEEGLRRKEGKKERKKENQLN